MLAKVDWKWWAAFSVAIAGIIVAILLRNQVAPTPGFETPTPGSAVPHMCRTQGVLAEPLLGGRTLRFCVREKFGPDAYGPWQPQDNNSALAERGLQWSSVVPVGPMTSEAVNPHQDYVIYALSAEPQANDALDRYLAAAKQTGEWKGLTELPNGTSRLFVVAVRRSK